MNTFIKKLTSYILIGFILTVTVIALLGVWEVIDLKEVLRKIFLSLTIIFVAAAIVLFIFTVIIRDDKTKKPGE
ncbi:MAG: hypothetical protein HY738_00050 [Bacteroidia bacterium]|nr:hypothetical protein [Bacteroidia bacterium]